MTVKDFEVGQKVFILNMYEGRCREPEIREAKVKAVGRKYVTIDNGDRYVSEERFCFGLIQSVDYGDRTFLCPSITDTNNYIEQCQLLKWITNITWSRGKNYTLEQLRKVKEILVD